MTTYSVADAKNGLPGLIDRAQQGEEVIITRHGKAVAELRPVTSTGVKAQAASYAWLRDRRQARKGSGKRPSWPRPSVTPSRAGPVGEP